MSCWMTETSHSTSWIGVGVGLGVGVGVEAVSTVGAVVGISWGAALKNADAITLTPILALSRTATPPMATLYSGSRWNVLPEKYFMTSRFFIPFDCSCSFPRCRRGKP